MEKFIKNVVKTENEVKSILLTLIGGSFDYLPEDSKYPKEYPALLIIDPENKCFDFVYLSDFIWC